MSIGGAPGGKQDTTEILMTCTFLSMAALMAVVRVASVPPVSVSLDWELVCLNDMIAASGATPTMPSPVSCAAMTPATMVPWASQSTVAPALGSRKSPPSVIGGSRGCGATPVSIMPMVTPIPVASLWTSR